MVQKPKKQQNSTKQKVKKNQTKVKKVSLKTSQKAMTQRKKVAQQKTHRKAKTSQKAHKKVKAQKSAQNRVQAKSTKSKPVSAKKQPSALLKKTAMKKPVAKPKTKPQAKALTTKPVSKPLESKAKKATLKSRTKLDTKPVAKSKTVIEKTKVKKISKPVSPTAKAKKRPANTSLSTSPLKTDAKVSSPQSAKKTKPKTGLKKTSPSKKSSSKIGAKSKLIINQSKTLEVNEDLKRPHPVKKAIDAHKSKDTQQYDAIELAFNEEQVVLTNAEGQRFCYDKDCDQPATVDIYCRKHYILSWHLIEQKKQILEGDKLETFIKQITARYPDKFLEMIRKNLGTERDFTVTLQELGISNSSEGKKDSSVIDDSSLHFTEDMPLSR